MSPDLEDQCATRAGKPSVTMQYSLKSATTISCLIIITRSLSRTGKRRLNADEFSPRILPISAIRHSLIIAACIARCLTSVSNVSCPGYVRFLTTWRRTLNSVLAANSLIHKNFSVLMRGNSYDRLGEQAQSKKALLSSSPAPLRQQRRSSAHTNLCIPGHDFNRMQMQVLHYRACYGLRLAEFPASWDDDGPQALSARRV